jgi:hypothetical protein
MSRFAYKVRFWWCALKIFLRRFDGKPRDLWSLRWQFEAAFMARKPPSAESLREIMARSVKDAQAAGLHSFFEEAPHMTYTPSIRLRWCPHDLAGNSDACPEHFPFCPRPGSAEKKRQGDG